MIRKFFLFIIILGFSTVIGSAQSFVKTSYIFRRSDNNSYAGQLNIIQNSAIDTLISRYRLVNEDIKKDHGYYGMDGFRIQIYSSSNRNARDESNKAGADFVIKFPDIPSYQLFAEPGYYKIRAGDFRTKTEATRIFLIVSKEFPDAYLVPDIINFPDLNTK